MADDITYTWQNARVLWADIPVDSGAARAVLPPGLALADPPTATVFVADYPFTTFGSVYREAAVLLHGIDDQGPYVHCPWMVVDDDTALILGREMLGFPKKMAEIALEVDGDHVVGTVVRKGVELIRVEGTVDVGDDTPPALFDRRFVNLFGSIVNGMSLIELAPSGERFHECRRGDGKVLLGTSDRDALGSLAPATEATLRLATLDFAGGGDATQPRVVSGVTDDAWAFARFFARLM
jgi:acetoacetate decarboxylase